MKHKAVLTFIVERPGRIDFSGSIWANQPTRAPPPSNTSAAHSASRHRSRVGGAPASARAVFNPVGIGTEDLVDRPGDDARHFVAVQRGDALDQIVALPVM